MYDARMTVLRARMETAGIDVALITDDDSVYYLTGYCDYLHMGFGRPTILQSGMVLAVDGSASGDNFRAQMGAARHSTTAHQLTFALF